MPEVTTIGADWARAWTSKDFERAQELMSPDIDFRALTPKKFWEETSAEAVIANVFRKWLSDTDEPDGVEHIETDTVVDTERVGYRFSITNPEGEFVIEQQAFLRTSEGRINWIRIVCSGKRPISGD